MNTEWSATTKYIVSVGLVIFGLYVIYLSRSVLTLVVLAALAAFLLVPIVDFFNTRLKMPRGVAVLVTYLLAAVVILLSPLIFVPPIVDGLRFLYNIDYQILVENSLMWTQSTLQTLEQTKLGLGRYSIDLAPVVAPIYDVLQNAEQEASFALPSFETVINSLRSAATVTYGVASNIAGTVFSGVFTFIVLLLSAIYITVDAHRFSDIFVSIVPPAYKAEISRLQHRLAKTWRAYFRGQLMLMIIIGTVTWLGNTALGLPGAFALGFIAGVLELIPNLGPFLAAIPAVVVALLQGSTILPVSNLVFALIIVGFYILVQQFENTVVVPRILGEAVDLHPLVVLIGVLVGTNVAGILGALLAAPVIASVREIVRYLYKKIMNEPPFSSEEESEPPESALLAQSRKLISKAQAMINGKRGQAPPPVELPEEPAKPKAK
jgi:predicted PurR-regulated permease PerM